MKAMPGWLLQDARYQPRQDKDAFVDRSILRFLSVLSKGRARSGRIQGHGHTEPLVKVLSIIVVALLVSLTRSPAFLVLTATGLLVSLAFQEARLIARVLKTSLAVAVFTVLILLPSVFWGRGSAAVMITVKVFLSVAFVKLVSATADWASISGAFKRLGAPDLFILVFDIALKYITLLGEFALSMLYALKLRSVGRNTGKTASLGGIAGTLFLKSKEMAEDMYGAMECRGFTGEYRAAGRLRLRWRDGMVCGATGLLIALFFLTRAR
jgi:cobalt/nickel transport system permease protein